MHQERSQIIYLSLPPDSARIQIYIKWLPKYKIITADWMDSTLSKSPFPLQEIAYEELESSKKAIIKKMLYTFVFYASKSSKHSYQEMHENNFMELMSDLWETAGK